MIEKVTYRNHLNEEFHFDENGAFLNAGGLRDYSWKAVNKNNRISVLEKDVTQFKLPIYIIAPTEEKGIELKNQLFEIVEKDVLAMEKGRFIVGDHYLQCYVTASSKSEYLKSARCMKVTLTVQTDSPFWIKESKYGFYKIPTYADHAHLDYNFDYPIDYWVGSHNSRILRNSAFTDSNFRMVIYGYCNYPQIKIGDHLYQLNVAIIAGSRAVIDSEKKTIVLIDKDGNETNIFSKRNRDSYIFKKIPAGLVHVELGEAFDLDIIIKEERSEPKWT